MAVEVDSPQKCSKFFHCVWLGKISYQLVGERAHTTGGHSEAQELYGSLQGLHCGM